GGAEAVYAHSVIVPAGCALDLNGLHLYARGVQVSGTVLNGSISQIPDSGPLVIATPTPGNISAPGELDEWTFFGRAGKLMSILVNPGTTGSSAPVSPQVLWVNVQLLDSADNVISTVSNSTSGALVTLSNVTLPVDGTYRIRINAPAGHTAATGNYIVGVWDVTPNVRSLNLGQEGAGNLATPFALDRWNFSAVAGQQIQFDLIASSNSAIAFKLIGPGNAILFQDITADSALINLPASGNYVLSAYGLNGAAGSYSFVMKQTSVNALAPGVVYNGSWAGSGQAQLFSIPVTAANPLSIVLTDTNTGNHTELYARFGTPPTRTVYDYASKGAGASHSLLVPLANPGTWYVLVYGESVPSGAGSFTLQANSTAILVSGTSLRKSVSNIDTTFTLTGAGFTPATSVVLVGAAGAEFGASSSTTDSPTQITATFNQGLLPGGDYTVKVLQPDGSFAVLPQTIHIAQVGQGVLTANIEAPSAVGRHAAATFYVTYANTGNAPMAAPLLILDATNPSGQRGAFLTLDANLRSSGFWTSSIPVGHSSSIQILASGATPGILQPGEFFRVPVYYSGWNVAQWNFQDPRLNFALTTIKADDATAVDWASMESSMRPSSIPVEAWHVMYMGLLSQLGGTAGGFVRLLDNQATYLARLGQNVTDVNRLWGFAVAQAQAIWPMPTVAGAVDDSVPTPGALALSFGRAFNQTIPGRFRMGPLGLGWFTPWQQRLTFISDGTVTLETGSGGRSIYQPDSRYAGRYFSQPGDHNTFTSGSGGYRLTAPNGTVTVFNGNGTLNYLEDTNGNRITAGYTGGRLATLTSSSGKSLTLAYNAAGLISAVTDSLGRVTAYSYDAGNQHLLSVASFTGRITSYGYNTTAGSPALNALTSIAFPDGTHQYFTHDNAGRIASTFADGGTLTKSFTYDRGQVSTTDALGHVVSLFFDHNGQLSRTIDALGNPTVYNYDESFNLARVTNANGASAAYSYNEVGKVTLATDFLGHTTNLSYGGPQHQLTALSDANGNTTLYHYDAKGNMLGSTFANGRSEQYTYDPLGNALSFTNAAGQATAHAYNAAGQLASANFADGSSFTYTYDAEGHLLTAVDATGTTSFTYDPATRLLMKVEYPNGKWLAFEYDPGGRRNRMIDQDAFTTRYVYDAVGRLSQLRDGGDQLVVSYQYDAAGRLARKDNGN
ncbi:MAG TPA: hypothetical protein VD994_05210, partial [Prosthecobacter sp.]|nr:hypothetical protein [Prosthecobacter sp.]